ncbi:coenzyme F420-0:L-glutamate ligase [Kineococcus indalonis]|uniref:coenzyme F420-0:L-glutamate ligase n=1 Tax=Kineococcus indalonis TaxID=2696566 RepID=UPI001F11833D|nr:coenzyme F420-0:L-glutamate ligase [Kineococcus indalonis]
MRSTTSLQVVGITGVGEVAAGDDLARVLVDALHAQRTSLVDGDVVAVSSKVVSKARGLTAPLAEREAVVAAQSVRTVAARRTPAGLASIVQAVAGPVMAAAGVDASNVAEGTVLLLPADADAEARALRAGLRALTGADVGVVVTDTAGRAWREGQTDFALGVAGLAVLDDLRGELDASGRPMSVTARAIADEVAATADLVKGKTDGVPAALVRGLAGRVSAADGPGARSLLRPPASDWFRLGHVEAVRAAIGAADAPPPPVVPGTRAEQLERVAQVAAAGGPGRCSVEDGEGGGDGPLLRLRAEDAFSLGALAQRALAALWTEDLTGTVERRGPRAALVRVAPAPTAPEPARAPATR